MRTFELAHLIFVGECVMVPRVLTWQMISGVFHQTQDITAFEQSKNENATAKLFRLYLLVIGCLG